MVLLSVENLPETELRYIAQQENVENWDSLSRDELVEILESIGELDFSDNEKAGVPSNHRFVKGITDVGSDFLQLPGVEPLPTMYNETAVHLVPRDNYWAYSFFSISISDEAKLQENPAELVLRLCSSKASYEINITPQDECWNVELPWPEETYCLKLIARRNEEDEVLAVSNKITLNHTEILNKPEALDDPDTFKLLVPELTNKNGKLMDNILLREIIEKAMGAQK